MKVEELRKTQLKKERMAEKLGLYLEEIAKADFNYEGYLSLRNRFRFRLFIFASLCVFNAVLTTLALLFFLQTTSVELYSTSYTSEIENLNFLRTRDDKSYMKVKYVIGDDKAIIHQFNKSDLERL